MARLKSGVSPTPAADRLKLYREGLESRGGRRLIIDLSPEGAAALTQIVERDTAPDALRPVSLKDAVTKALVNEAKRRVRA